MVNGSSKLLRLWQGFVVLEYKVEDLCQKQGCVLCKENPSRYIWYVRMEELGSRVSFPFGVLRRKRLDGCKL